MGKTGKKVKFVKLVDDTQVNCKQVDRENGQMSKMGRWAIKVDGVTQKGG